MVEVEEGGGTGAGAGGDKVEGVEDSSPPTIST